MNKRTNKDSPLTYKRPVQPRKLLSFQRARQSGLLPPGEGGVRKGLDEQGARETLLGLGAEAEPGAEGPGRGPERPPL